MKTYTIINPREHTLMSKNRTTKILKLKQKIVKLIKKTHIQINGKRMKLKYLKEPTKSSVNPEKPVVKKYTYKKEELIERGE